MNNVYKKIITSLFLLGLVSAPLQNFAAAAGPFSNNQEHEEERKEEKVEAQGLDQETPEALPECITLKFMGSDQSVQVPRGALMLSELGKTAFDENSEETELVLDQSHDKTAGFSLQELAELLQVSDWKKYLENKDDVYLYRLFLAHRYFGLPDLYDALTQNIGEKISKNSIAPFVGPFSSSSPEENQFARDSAKKVILDRILNRHTDSVRSVAWSPDGSQIVSGSVDTTVRIWDATTGENTRTLNGHTGSVESVAWSPDGSQIVSGSNDNTVRIWNAATGESRTLNGHTLLVHSVAWSPDGSQIVSGSWDNTVRIWNAATGNLARTLNGHTGRVSSVAWSPDGSQIVSGSWDRTVRIWNAATGELIRILIGHTWAVKSVAWSPDGSQIVSGSDDDTVRMWNAATGESRTLNRRTGRVSSVAWSPDGSQIVSGSWDDTVRIWNATTGENTKTLNGHTGRVSSVAWSPDGSQIASGSYDNTVRIWGESLEQKRAEALRWIQAQEMAFQEQLPKADASKKRSREESARRADGIEAYQKGVKEREANSKKE